MVLAIAVIRKVLIARLPKRTFVILWEIALLRLLIPIRVSSVLSIYTIFSSIERKSEGIVFQPADISVSYIAQNTAANADTYPVANTLEINRFSVWTIVWLAGAAIMLFGFVTAYIIVFSRYRGCEIIKGGYGIEWLKAHKIKRNVRLAFSDRISSPLTYGIFRPIILFPKNIDMDDKRCIDFVLLHELTHIKRFDMIRKLAVSAALCVHWFNPLVWVLYFLFNRDIELTCDEIAVGTIGIDRRSDYALALVNMEERRSRFTGPYYNFNGNAIKERTILIMKTKKISIITMAVSWVIILSMTTIFATSASVADEPESGITETDTEYSEEETEIVTGSALPVDSSVDSEDTYTFIDEIDETDETDETDESAISTAEERILCPPLKDRDFEIEYEGLSEMVSVFQSYKIPHVTAEFGTDVYAVEKGTVVYADFVHVYGLSVLLSHPDGTFTFYAHLNDIKCELNEEVNSGDIIGHVGTTGMATEPKLTFARIDRYPGFLEKN